MAIEVSVETITSDIAERYLEANSGNFRTLDRSRVDAYASDMVRGDWDANGEAIKFGIDGVLLDGQHRLAAVVKSGVAIQCVVVRGVESSARNIDRGKPRTVAQWLSHTGIKNAMTIAAASRLCVGHGKKMWSRSSLGIGCVTGPEIIRFAEQHHEALNRSIVHNKMGIPLAPLTAILFLGSNMTPADENPVALWFRTGLTTGSGIGETDAVFHLRNRLLQQTGGKKLTQYMMRMLLTIAWNKTALGLPCTSSGLRLSMSGPNAQVPPNRVEVVRKDI